MRVLTIAGPNGRPLFLDLSTLQSYEVNGMVRGVELGQLLEISEFEVMDRSKFRLSKIKGKSWSRYADSADVVVNTNEEDLVSGKCLGPHFIFSRLGEDYGADLT